MTHEEKQMLAVVIFGYGFLAIGMFLGWALARKPR